MEHCRAGPAQPRRLEPFKYDEGQSSWVQVYVEAIEPKGHAQSPEDECGILLKVGTINVLHDFFLPKELRTVTEARWRETIKCILEERAHIFVLTEVTEAFAKFLLSDSGIQSYYLASDAEPSGFSTVSGKKHETSQFILFSRDISVAGVYRHDLTDRSGKKVIAARCSTKSGVSVTLGALHLSSGYNSVPGSMKYPLKRKSQLRETINVLQTIMNETDIIAVVGDFNFKNDIDEEVCREELGDFLGGSAQITFDPTINGLAQLGSKDGGRERLDRVYLKPPESAPQILVQEYRVFLKSPIADEDIPPAVLQMVPGGVHPSDHFGLVVVFQVIMVPA